MFLGTPKPWWIAVGVLFLLGLGLLATGNGVAGVLLVIISLIAFAVAPMRYGRPPTKQAASPPPPAISLPVPPAGPRPTIEARDATDV